MLLRISELHFCELSDPLANHVRTSALMMLHPNRRKLSCLKSLAPFVTSSNFSRSSMHCSQLVVDMFFGIRGSVELAEFIHNPFRVILSAFLRFSDLGIHCRDHQQNHHSAPPVVLSHSDHEFFKQQQFVGSICINCPSK